MTARRQCPPAPGPLEEYAARFDDLFFSLAQRRGFREYLTGLLAPRERNKTLTCLAGAEPVSGAGMPGVQRLQFFLSESPWEVEQVNARSVKAEGRLPVPWRRSEGAARSVSPNLHRLPRPGAAPP